MAATSLKRRVNSLDDLAQLHDDNTQAISSEPTPRRIQDRGTRYDVSLSPDWCRQLCIAEQSEPVDVRLITGLKPVVVMEPSIIVRPHPEGVDE